ncbi:phosphocholine cytidylyltransferase family protein [Pseudomonas sp. 681]|uniref:Phosphocholine cytidylyltransferase family protein n=1 Tax=Pseudomonas fungipugnans TaxID=3024217 RepID=A0ABT6QLS5_9PSED|nr:phosphocholine cytidylyltransferase family protein [Pseudomonas sp. 681]MDI2591837.1 phosphocholine cytidylyltransferase family protein [Pseudomonas sp. 681]
MKAIILAAGRGSRLGALTDQRPKALVTFNGVPLIERTVRTLRAAGITEIGIVAGYRSDMLAPYADRLFINPLWSTTGIRQSLSAAHEWLDSQACVVSYGDIFYSSELVSALMQKNEDIDLAFDPQAVKLWQQRFDQPLEDMERFVIDNGRICEIGHRAETLEQIQGQYMGLFKLTPAGWHALNGQLERLSSEQREQVDMTSLFSLLIEAGVRVGGTPTNAPWGEIDCPSDVQLYERIYPQL